MFSQQYEMNEDEGPVGFWVLILLKFEIFLCFYILISFKKKYYFNIFLNKKYFKK